MSDDTDELPARERARTRSRDRKMRGPRVVVDNAGLKKLTVDLAEKRRQQPGTPAAKPPGRKARRRPSGTETLSSRGGGSPSTPAPR